MEFARSHKPKLRLLIEAQTWARIYARVLIAASAWLVSSCDDGTQLNAAVEALKSREAKVTAREQASEEREQEFLERELQIAATTAALDRQRAELDALKKSLLDQIAETKRRQDAL